MRVLLLSLCLSFSGIFFVFSKVFQGPSTIDSLFVKPFIGSVLFFILGLFLFVYFSKTKTITYNENTYDPYLNTREIQKIIKDFFSRYLYYLGVIVFYFSFYCIFLGLGSTGYFPYFVFLLNIGVLFLVFITKKSYIIQDLLKINTIVFSLLYVLYYIISLVFQTGFFIAIDFINSLLILILFLVFLGLKDTGKREYIGDPIITGYFFFYTIIFSVFYGNLFIGSSILTSGIVTFLWGIVVFYVPGFLRFFKRSTQILRTIGILSICSSLPFFVIHSLLNSISLASIVFILGGSIFTYRIHKLYENYFSLFFSFLGVFFVFSQIYLLYFYVGEYKNFLLLGNYLLISQILIIYTYIYESKYIYDVFLLHIFAYIVNLFGISLFLFFTGFDILNLGIILLFESVFIFSSYYKLNPLYQGQK